MNGDNGPAVPDLDTAVVERSRDRKIGQFLVVWKMRVELITGEDSGNAASLRTSSGYFIGVTQQKMEQTHEKWAVDGTKQGLYLRLAARNGATTRSDLFHSRWAESTISTIMSLAVR